MTLLAYILAKAVNHLSMILAQQHREVIRHFYMLTYYNNDENPEKQCTVVVVLPFLFELIYSFTGSDYQSTADYLAGGVVRAHAHDNSVCEQRASTIEIVHIENEEAIALESTYLAIMTLIATTIQHVRNKPVQICVKTDNTSTTEQNLTSAINFTATAREGATPTVVTSLLHQLREDESLKSYLKTLSEQTTADGTLVTRGIQHMFPGVGH
jgi:hypothetical protein